MKLTRLGLVIEVGIFALLEGLSIPKEFGV